MSDNVDRLERATFAMTVDFKLREQLRKIFTSDDFQELKITNSSYHTIQPSIHYWKLMKKVEANIDMFPSDCPRLFIEEVPTHDSISNWSNKFDLPPDLVISYYATASEILMHFIQHKDFLNFTAFSEISKANNTSNKQIEKSLCGYLNSFRSIINEKCDSVENILANQLFDSITIENTFSAALSKYQESYNEIMDYYNYSDVELPDIISLLQNCNTRMLIALLSKDYTKISTKIPEILQIMSDSNIKIRPSTVSEFIRKNANYMMIDSVNLEKQNMSFRVMHDPNVSEFGLDELDKDLQSSYIDDSLMSQKSKNPENTSVLSSSLRPFSLSNVSNIMEGIKKGSSKELSLMKPNSNETNKNEYLENEESMIKDLVSNDNDKENIKNINENDGVSSNMQQIPEESVQSSKIDFEDEAKTKINLKSRSTFVTSKEFAPNKIKNTHNPPHFHEYKKNSPFCKHCGIPHAKGEHVFNDSNPPKLNESLYQKYKKVLDNYKPEAYQKLVEKYRLEKGYNYNRDGSIVASWDDNEDSSEFDPYEDFFDQ